MPYIQVAISTLFRGHMANNAYFTLNSYTGSIDSISTFTGSAMNKGSGQPLGGILQFPPGLGGAAVQDGVSAGSSTIPFTLFMPYKRNSGTKAAYSTQSGDDLYSNLPTPDFAIALPTPPSALKTNYGVEYEEFQIGQAVGAALSNQTEAIQSLAGGGIGALLGGGLGAVAGATAGSLISGGNITKSAGWTAAQAAIGLIGTVSGGNGQATAATITGLQDNPFTENVFKNVKFREHTFAYTFMPKNLRESETIDKIISVFKYTMLPIPAVGNIFFEFPYEFQIIHSIQNTTFTLLPSVLTSFTVDYGGGTDSLKLFVAKEGKQYPAKITVEMSFKEMVLLNRNRVKKDFDLKDESAPSDIKYRFRF